MINMIPNISNITYNQSALPQEDFLQYFNQAIAAGYDPTEARRIAKIKVKEAKDEKKKKAKPFKDRLVESTEELKQHIDRRA